jgi:apolipoprotein N-acyltransferase
MSAKDIETILNTPKLFLFIPVLNYVYIVANVDSKNSFYLAIAAVVSSAFLYNVLDGVPVSEAKKVGLAFTISFFSSLVLWFSTLIKSVLELKILFTRSDMIAEALFFVTIGFIAVVCSHLVLTQAKQYRNSM